MKIFFQTGIFSQKNLFLSEEKGGKRAERLTKKSKENIIKTAKDSSSLELDDGNNFFLVILNEAERSEESGKINL